MRLGPWGLVTLFAARWALVTTPLTLAGLQTPARLDPGEGLSGVSAGFSLASAGSVAADLVGRHDDAQIAREASRRQVATRQPQIFVLEQTYCLPNG